MMSDSASAHSSNSTPGGGLSALMESDAVVRPTVNTTSDSLPGARSKHR